jgi:Kef-type K+ transport system membrane component KefB
VFIDIIDHFKSSSDVFNILLLLGIALFGGTIGGKFFTKIRFPSVVGYIIIGIILGRTGLNLINEDILTALKPFSYFALGLIGFMIGGELKLEIFQKYGKQFLSILLFEGLTAFVIVSSAVFVLGYFLTDNISNSISLGLLLGAISSATAPAATTDVLWENKTRGPITRTVLGIVALDDALALILFAFAVSIAQIFCGIGSNDVNFFVSLLYPVYEMAGAVIIGSSTGFLLSKMLKQNYDEEKILPFSIGLIILTLGIALATKTDMLLASMSCGALIINFTPKRSKEIFQTVGKFTPPIFILFFVLVGANLSVKSMSTYTIIFTLIYLLGRTSGKMLGAWSGAIIGKAPVSVQKYLPFCLFSQAGVAIGLSILAGQKFSGPLGESIVVIVTASTFVVQLAGPPLVKFAVTRGKEVGLNITENDLLKRNTVNDALKKDIPPIFENTSLNQILAIFSENDNLYYPVVTSDNKVLGVITINNLKDTFLAYELSEFLVAFDLMEPIDTFINKSDLLSEANEKFTRTGVEFQVVVDKNREIAGILEKNDISRFISQKIAELHQKANDLG